MRSKGLLRHCWRDADCLHGRIDIRREKGIDRQAERAALLGFILSGSILQGHQVVPTFKSPFDIIRRIAQEAKACANGDHSHADIKKQAPELASNACPTLLPLLDELRTYFYEHQVEEIPALLAV